MMSKLADELESLDANRIPHAAWLDAHKAEIIRDLRRLERAEKAEELLGKVLYLQGLGNVLQPVESAEALQNLSHQILSQAQAFLASRTVDEKTDEMADVRANEESEFTGLPEAK